MNAALSLDSATATVSARQPLPFTVSFSMVTWSPGGTADGGGAGVGIVADRSSAAIAGIPGMQASIDGPQCARSIVGFIDGTPSGTILPWTSIPRTPTAARH
ncbi:hypothetical protein GCM10010166_15930 [Couchioplanes caeruleus subsp. azureus]|nr:hypothetical protein GCM10010166_15930 [Couchioplanes caeruleus subsp. azureus]